MNVRLLNVRASFGNGREMVDAAFQRVKPSEGHDLGERREAFEREWVVKSGVVHLRWVAGGVATPSLVLQGVAA